MSDSLLAQNVQVSDSSLVKLPISSIVRAVCQAASGGPELLYEVMIKMSLMVEATAPTYGLSIWSAPPGHKPSLRWAEGLEESEIALGEQAVAAILGSKDRPPAANQGDQAICLLLALPSPAREGAALYGRCVRPLTTEQAKELNALSEVAFLAHARQSPRVVNNTNKSPISISSASVLPGMVFSSRAMSDVAVDVERIKDSESTILVTGESGTGKELIARAIHRLSRRSECEFIPFNCSAAPTDLIESMLFGHRKGSFTGANSDQLGLILAAENGTLFLDEIGDLPLGLQPKLLRFLQEGEIHTLGDRAPRKVNVRVIAATHKDLEQLVKEKLFREDLYYRIATLTLKVPPLRERPEDISTLISHFISLYARKNEREIAGITWEAIQTLEEYSWPGNIRELAGEIERLVLYADDGGYIQPDNISLRIRPDGTSFETSAEKLDDLLENYERRVITETLKRHDCNVAKASEALGLGSRQTLYKKLKRLAIDVSEFLQEDTEPGLQFRSPQR
ncbi:MAG TPA: sigma-54 dependent transcriptional regulator [Pyrinomonadaceae bacterium]|jgi:Transcriptional regulator containing PAS, AAA-type ATPase, and DNA-binding domains|nr:sigma-54 dependent transcriptional regulator [Pyrinomonadaceae bacterium]